MRCGNGEVRRIGRQTGDLRRRQRAVRGSARPCSLPTIRTAPCKRTIAAPSSTTTCPPTAARPRNQLAATLGRLLPPLWKEMAQAEIDRAGKVGQYETLRRGHRGASSRAQRPSPSNSTAPRRIGERPCLLRPRSLRPRRSKKPRRRTIRWSRRTWWPPRVRRARAAPSGTTPAPGPFPTIPTVGTARPNCWPKTASTWSSPTCSGAGSPIIPATCSPAASRSGGTATRSSSVAPPRSDAGSRSTFGRSTSISTTAPKDFVEKLRREGRTQVSVKGEPSDWLCPSNSRQPELEIDSLLEVVRKYPVDGLHLDYIRYPGREYCYCDGCRRRFEAASGRKVANWPKDCFSRRSPKTQYNDWRCRQITELVDDDQPRGEADPAGPEDFRGGVRCLSRLPRVGRPGLARRGFKAGSLDFVCPMDYTADDTELASLVRSQVKLDRRPRAALRGHRRHGHGHTSDAGSRCSARSSPPDRWARRASRSSISARKPPPRSSRR